MLEQRLRQLAEDAPRVDPATSVVDVMKRGRLWSFAFRATATASGVAVAAVMAVGVPAVLEGAPAGPDVLAVPDEAPSAGGRDTTSKDEGRESPSDGAAGVEVAQVTFDVAVAIRVPTTGAVTEAAEVVVEGDVDPEAVVTVQGLPAEVAESRFRRVVPLAPGRNAITVVARVGEDRFGIDKVIVKRVVADVDPEPAPKAEPKPEPEPEPKPAPEVTFTAEQVHDQVEHDPPYSVYEGTAPAGSWVKVHSSYGYGKVQAASDGTWRVKVWFDAAPYGTHTWPVTAYLLGWEREQTFEFTGTRPAPSGDTDVAFTANQLRGESAATPPTDVFWGTAHPATQVWIYSEYGEAVVTADEVGDWEVEVAFPDAPVGKSFPVKVKSLHTGEKVLFEFTRIG